MNIVFDPNINATDQIYINLRDSELTKVKAARELTERLWATYQPYSDKQFLIELANDFDSRFWEMYLTCTLIDKGFSPDKNRKAEGPDVKLRYGKKTIWIEAIAPTGGAANSRDKVPELWVDGQAHPVPDDQVKLRYCSAIQEKYENKYFKYLEKGTLSKKDVYIIAVNGCKIHSSGAEFEPPRIVRSVLPIGNQVVSIDKNTGSIVGTHYEHTPYVKKSSGSTVNTDIFTNSHYKHLSAIIFSNVDVANPTDSMGEDFIIVHNPLASEKVDDTFSSIGSAYRAQLHKNEIIVY